MTAAENFDPSVHGILYAIYDLETGKWLGNIRATDAREAILEYRRWPAVDLSRHVFAERRAA